MLITLFSQCLLPFLEDTKRLYALKPSLLMPPPAHLCTNVAYVPEIPTAPLPYLYKLHAFNIADLNKVLH